MSFIVAFVLFILFPAGSVFYVYRMRGDANFDSFTQYLRKGWPVFAPLNVFLYMNTKKHSQGPFVNVDNFKNLHLLEDNWQVIAQEVQHLYDNGFFSQTTDKNNASSYDVGFRTFYKYGWSKFYCTWYGTNLNSALKHCPKTVELLAQIPSVNGSMFTLLPAGSQLTPHSDPIACSLRYHLGLNTPNDQDCFLNIDGKVKVWNDGQGFLFDETYIHYAKNNTDKMRLILMCDIERPMNIFGRAFNQIYKILVKQMVVPNLPGDQAGIVNKLFSKVTPFLAKAKALKMSDPKLYYPVKWCFNLVLMVIFVSILMAVYTLIVSIFN